MKCIALGVSLAAVVATTASADLVYNFGPTVFTAGNYRPLFTPGEFNETISSISIDITITNFNSTAEDFVVAIGPYPILPGVLAQFGGWNSLGAAQWQHTGGEVQVVDTMTLAEPIDFTGTNFGAWIGCTEGNQSFTGSVTLHTVAVPAPGAMAVLGLAGLVGGRRRRA